jgi:hypothetical protein
MSPASVLDRVAAAASELARAAAVEVGGSELIGEALGVTADGERLVVHHFACLDPAYRGWQWSVTVARASRSTLATVCEVVLLPGEDAVLAPPWLPWQERLRPGDLRVGDILPAPPDDPRLVPSFLSVEEPDEQMAQVALEVGLGRPRVLSLEGREHAATRWHSGDAGPASPIARAAPADCATCGFFVPLAGALRQAFGACANAFAPDDGRIVSADHGCGAHSETVSTVSPDPAPPLLDELGFEPVAAGEGGSAEVERDQSVGSVADSDAAEPLGHS